MLEREGDGQSALREIDAVNTVTRTDRTRAPRLKEQVKANKFAQNLGPNLSRFAAGLSVANRN